MWDILTVAACGAGMWALVRAYVWLDAGYRECEGLDK